ncbi:hypothetical protein FRC07_011189, partial [Ceratobasidium sp. 392]
KDIRQVLKEAGDEEDKDDEALDVSVDDGPECDNDKAKPRDDLGRWILQAIELENAQDKLRIDAARLGKNSTPRQHNVINGRRKNLINLVAAHRQERERYLGTLGDPDHPQRPRVQSSDIEFAELGLPSAYESASLTTVNCLQPPRSEARLRRATCDETLRVVRNLLGAKSLTIRYKRKNLTGEGATTRAEGELKTLQEKVERARRRYNRSRDALLRLDLLGADHTTYLALELDHLTMLSDYLDNESGTIGEGTRAISWIWRSQAVSNDEDWMIDALKVEWFRARQRATQWQEELILLKREMAMTLNTFRHEQREWEARSGQSGLFPGMREYATRKVAFFARLASDTHSRGTALIKDPVVTLQWATAQWPEDAPAPTDN